MKVQMKTVWYIDDDNIRHYTVVHHNSELVFLRMRFDFVGVVSD